MKFLQFYSEKCKELNQEIINNINSCPDYVKKNQLFPQEYSSGTFEQVKMDYIGQLD